MFNSPVRRVSLGRSPQSFTWMSTDGHRTKWRKHIDQNFNRLNREHQRYRQTDDRQTDRRWPIANVNVNSRSIKIQKWDRRSVGHCSCGKKTAPSLMVRQQGGVMRFHRYGPVTLTLAQWPWYMSFTWLFWQDAQLSLRDRAAGCVTFGQKWPTGTGRQYFTDIIGLPFTTLK